MIQEFDNRNKDIKVWINGELLHRDQAKVSVFDSIDCNIIYLSDITIRFYQSGSI